MRHKDGMVDLLVYILHHNVGVAAQLEKMSVNTITLDILQTVVPCERKIRLETIYNCP